MGTAHRCIWCKRMSPEVQFNSLSHVLPEAVGNTKWILPRGTVCDPCNQYFGSKIEPGLLDDPLFHVRAVVVGLIDPGDMDAFRSKVFDATTLLLTMSFATSTWMSNFKGRNSNSESIMQSEVNWTASIHPENWRPFPAPCTR